MRLSWNIQRSKKAGRAHSLTSAWTIVLNEDVTIQYLVKRHSHSHQGYSKRVQPASLQLFQHR
ncbi:MAG: hypothetical protein ACTHMC_22225 [Pseudobacter sp.]|uniref:hypothetical protein n=1 Tax=Pseudobacter sp. TaxID=2045420 RepID=UPI003F809732